jgi:UDP-glucose 4-epimerase
VADVLRALVGLADSWKAEGEIFNVGSQREITILDLAHRIIELSGSKSRIEFIPYDKAYESGFEDMRRRVPNTQKIRKLIGWEPEIALEQTLLDVIQEFEAAADGASAAEQIQAIGTR